MTTPDERARAQGEARAVLREICAAEYALGVDSALKLRAEGALRHLASPSEIRDVLTMAIRLHCVEQEKEWLRKAEVASTLRVFLRGAPALVAFFLLGVWVGRVIVH